MANPYPNIDWDTYGVSIDSPCSIAAACSHSHDTEPWAFQAGGNQSIPTSILLPRFQGEPFRLDLGPTAHPRGNGKHWPPESIASLTQGVGRFPVCLLFETLRQDRRLEWAGGDQRAISVSDAFAGALADFTHTQNFFRDFAFVIPNSFGEALQQQLLDSFQNANLRVKLLWRPVAAALKWVDEHKSSSNLLTGIQSDTSIGKLLSVYLGFDTVEVTELDLVASDFDGELVLLPGRHRPNNEDTIPSFGLKQLTESMLTQKTTRFDQFGQFWNQLWCSRFLQEQQSVAEDFSNHPPQNVVDFSNGLASGLQQRPISEVSKRLSHISRRLNRQPLGIVISGPMARLVMPDSNPVWQWAVQQLRVGSERITLEHSPTTSTLLAKGGALFARNLKAGKPTYLDTLPKLEMVISKKGDPSWINLLPDDHKWVSGGKTWSRPESVTDLAIPANYTTLKLAVAHEEFDHVREVETELPCCSESEEHVSLSVRIEPAQGKARVEVLPDREDLFEKQRVFVDWRKMEIFETESGDYVDKQGYLVHLPRVYPELLPRLSSATKWTDTRLQLKEIWQLMKRNARQFDVELQLGLLREFLREKDQSMYPQDATAFDSDGNSPDPNWDMTAFMNVAWTYYEANQPNDFMRAMAYTSTDHADFLEHVANHFFAFDIHSDYIIAAGKCLRSPDHIAIFVDRFISQLGYDRVNQTWWKALSELLRFRSNTTENLELHQCETLISAALEVFVTEINKGGLTFRCVCLVIVYLLRKRDFDDDFLEPDSGLAIKVKSAFQQAILLVQQDQLKLMGGSVDLSQQLQLIIDYIDRKGRGPLLIGA